MKSIPKFKNEDKEIDFWSKNSSTDYINWEKSKKVDFPNLKPSCKSISLKLPESLLNDLKKVARKRGIPYSSLIKNILSVQVKKEANYHKY